MRKGLLLLALVGAFIIGGLVQPASAAAELDGCGPQAIIHCGATDQQTFINKVKRNAKGDLKDIYSAYGLTPDKYDEFARDAVKGTLEAKNNRIKVNNQVVGYSTLNLGRLHQNGFAQKVTLNVNGQAKDYWGGAFDATYDVDIVSVMVYFDKKTGNPDIVIINGTGSPQKIRPFGATYSCTQLKQVTVKGQPNARDFTTAASTTKAAHVVGVTYNFGDGTPKQTVSIDKPFRHVFTQSSDVRATLMVQMPGGVIVNSSSQGCTQHVNYVQPAKPKPTPKPTPAPTPKPAPATPTTTQVNQISTCPALSATLTDANARSYQFTAQAQLASGVSLVNADLNFGDGVTSNGVQPNGNKVIIGHSYSKAGNYTVTASLHLSNNATVMCQTTVTASDVIAAAPAATTSTTAPQATNDQLVNTGPGEVAFGLFATVTAAAAGAHWYSRRRLGY